MPYPPAVGLGVFQPVPASAAKPAPCQSGRTRTSEFPGSKPGSATPFHFHSVVAQPRFELGASDYESDMLTVTPPRSSPGRNRTSARFFIREASLPAGTTGLRRGWLIPSQITMHLSMCVKTSWSLRHRSDSNRHTPGCSRVPSHSATASWWTCRELNPVHNAYKAFTSTVRSQVGGTSRNRT